MGMTNRHTTAKHPAPIPLRPRVQCGRDVGVANAPVPLYQHSVPQNPPQRMPGSAYHVGGYVGGPPGPVGANSNRPVVAASNHPQTNNVSKSYHFSAPAPLPASNHQFAPPSGATNYHNRRPAPSLPPRGQNEPLPAKKPGSAMPLSSVPASAFSAVSTTAPAPPPRMGNYTQQGLVPKPPPMTGLRAPPNLPNVKNPPRGSTDASRGLPAAGTTGAPVQNKVNPSENNFVGLENLVMAAEIATTDQTENNKPIPTRMETSPTPKGHEASNSKRKAVEALSNGNSFVNGATNLQHPPTTTNCPSGNCDNKEGDNSNPNKSPKIDKHSSPGIVERDNHSLAKPIPVSWPVKSLQNEDKFSWPVKSLQNEDTFGLDILADVLFSRSSTKNLVLKMCKNKYEYHGTKEESNFAHQTAALKQLSGESNVPAPTRGISWETNSNPCRSVSDLPCPRAPGLLQSELKKSYEDVKEALNRESQATPGTDKQQARSHAAEAEAAKNDLRKNFLLAMARAEAQEKSEETPATELKINADTAKAEVEVPAAREARTQSEAEKGPIPAFAGVQARLNGKKFGGKYFHSPELPISANKGSDGNIGRSPRDRNIQDSNTITSAANQSNERQVYFYRNTEVTPPPSSTVPGKSQLQGDYFGVNDKKGDPQHPGAVPIPYSFQPPHCVPWRDNAAKTSGLPNADPRTNQVQSSGELDGRISQTSQSLNALPRSVAHSNLTPTRSVAVSGEEESRQPPAAAPSGRSDGSKQTTEATRGAILHGSLDPSIRQALVTSYQYAVGAPVSDNPHPKAEPQTNAKGEVDGANSGKGTSHIATSIALTQSNQYNQTQIPYDNVIAKDRITPRPSLSQVGAQVQRESESIGLLKGKDNSHFAGGSEPPHFHPPACRPFFLHHQAGADAKTESPSSATSPVLARAGIQLTTRKNITEENNGMVSAQAAREDKNAPKASISVEKTENYCRSGHSVIGKSPRFYATPPTQSEVPIYKNGAPVLGDLHSLMVAQTSARENANTTKIALGNDVDCASPHSLPPSTSDHQHQYSVNGSTAKSKVLSAPSPATPGEGISQKKVDIDGTHGVPHDLHAQSPHLQSLFPTNSTEMKVSTTTSALKPPAAPLPGSDTKVPENSNDERRSGDDTSNPTSDSLSPSRPSSLKPNLQQLSGINTGNANSGGSDPSNATPDPASVAHASTIKTNSQKLSGSVAVDLKDSPPAPNATPAKGVNGSTTEKCCPPRAAATSLPRTSPTSPGSKLQSTFNCSVAKANAAPPPSTELYSGSNGVSDCKRSGTAVVPQASASTLSHQVKKTNEDSFAKANETRTTAVANAPTAKADKNGEVGEYGKGGTPNDVAEQATHSNPSIPNHELPPPSICIASKVNDVAQLPSAAATSGPKIHPNKDADIVVDKKGSTCNSDAAVSTCSQPQAAEQREDPRPMKVYDDIVSRHKAQIASKRAASQALPNDDLTSEEDPALVSAQKEDPTLLINEHTYYNYLFTYKHPISPDHELVQKKCQYYDYSHFEEKDIPDNKSFIPEHPNFPMRLYNVLEDEKFSHAIVWLPHGRAFRIVDFHALMSCVLPVLLPKSEGREQTRSEANRKGLALNAFHKYLTNWRFVQLHSGPDKNSYYHEQFIRGYPHIYRLMTSASTTKEKIPGYRMDGKLQSLKKNIRPKVPENLDLCNEVGLKYPLTPFRPGDGDDDVDDTHVDGTRQSDPTTPTTSMPVVQQITTVTPRTQARPQLQPAKNPASALTPMASPLQAQQTRPSLTPTSGQRKPAHTYSSTKPVAATPLAQPVGVPVPVHPYRPYVYMKDHTGQMYLAQPMPVPHYHPPQAMYPSTYPAPYQHIPTPSYMPTPVHSQPVQAIPVAHAYPPPGSFYPSH